MQTYTKTQLVQMALAQLSTPYNVSNVDTDESNLGSQARLAWDYVIPWSLTKYDWKFATKRDQLGALIGYNIPQPWQFAYQIPSQALSILSVWPRTQFLRQESVILSNNNPLYLDYRYEPAINKWPTYFALHIMWEIAAFLAPSVSQDDATEKKVEKNRMIAESQALAANGQQITTIPVQSAPAISIRYEPGGSGYSDYNGWGGY